MIKKIIYLLYICNSLCLNAQIIADTSGLSKNANSIKMNLDNTSLISFSDKIIVKLNLDTRTNSFTFNNSIDKTISRIKPNDGSRVFLSVDYEFLGVSIGFSPKFIPGNNDDDKKGKSHFTDLRCIGFIGKMRQEFTYKKVKGYYLENTLDFKPNWQSKIDPFIQYPDLTTVRWSSITSYTLNPKFSILNLLYQTEWQRKSAGTLEPKLFLSYTQFKNRIGTSVEDIYEIRLAASYYYNFVFKKNWFISPFISPSLGIRFSSDQIKEDHQLISRKKQFLIEAMESGLQIGYASKTFIYGASFNFNANWYRQEEVINNLDDNIYGLVYFGYRFNSPKFVQKKFNWFNDKIRKYYKY